MSAAAVAPSAASTSAALGAGPAGSGLGASGSRNRLEHHAHLDKILDRPGPYTDESFEAGQSVKEFLTSKCKVLVIGAGGLGCEILANLALSGFRDIHVIDMDEIDVSNLNRQFLFRDKDVGRPKATVAAEFLERRVPGVKITPYHGKIQDKDDDYYMQFNLVICGLDSVEARRWINATLINLVDPENPESLKPLIDGGTEGFKGQARVILPTISSCYECSLDMLNKQTVFPICTIANTPRLPEHCIEWASVLEWPKVFPDKKLDNDNPDHIEWLYTQAAARAKQFNIEGVTWSLTQGVVKNIIPAIASTNAIIAAACTQEAFKIATTCAPFLNNYMMYTGNEGVYTYTFEHEKRPDCPVCGGESREISVQRDWPLQRVVDMLLELQDLQIKRPSLSGPNGPLYFRAPPPLEEATRPNLDKPLGELLEEGDEVEVTDASLPFQLTLLIKFER
ncbi:NEDD8 activating enzyme [Tilletia horrida]|nr:NEDD8 activating enzyme [Tilletia horrida]KAK0564592.1 NEDD8 activating enzyme [Tilletia horrida]